MGRMTVTEEDSAPVQPQVSDQRQVAAQVISGVFHKPVVTASFAFVCVYAAG